MNTLMKENTKKEYDAPMVELIEARVEKGFQGSGAATEGALGASGTEGVTNSGNSYGDGAFD